MSADPGLIRCRNCHKAFASFQKVERFGEIFGDDSCALDWAAKRMEQLQAKIDSLMLEYCPDEMTAEQVANWGRNQKPVSEGNN